MNSSPQRGEGRVRGTRDFRILRNASPALLAVALILTALPLRAENAAPVKLEMVKAPKLGKNVFKVNVSFSNGQSGAGKYNLMYYVGDKPGQIFNGIKMPYSFNLSLNGIYTGTYQIKVAVEDQNQRIVESNAVTVVTK